MTAEERMACFQGQRRRVSTLPENEKNYGLLFLKIKFFICMILFTVFLSLDYTGMKINRYGSEEIVRLVTEDFTIDDQIFHEFLKALNIA